ncbi:hypothetical protein GMDG_06651 [Pseudogymnoascus destructans 20631-21]|uniref:tRNA-dihydrouridine(16/17) synthase [NAD(P)(+)] n=1 Tax=Pseudogymnoascus destructans (strain ATCC MYA-4855 / 20631-21) TaxID=658429 RepID=L8FUS6_PSED2|nr:hypothetical protein GMDG_06651 [Pseudogymnoascus destructans 20631-21]
MATAPPEESIQTPTAPTTAAADSPNLTKLHGRAFYESIGSPKFVLAPMVDQSEFAWRMLTRSYMTPESTKDLLAYSPMLHARLFTTTEKFRFNHFQPTRSGLPNPPLSAPPAESADIYLDGNPTIDRPLFVQFCANTPEDLLAAAQYVAPFCDAVDLNLGCPQGIARKGGYGAFLQEDQELIYALINTLHTRLAVPVTAKIRVLKTRKATLAYAKKVLSAGASILTVHGRLREAKGHKTGLADWAAIRHLRDNLPKETVIFANGNILSRGDIERCLEATGADAVMSADGNLYDPAIFAPAPEVGGGGSMYWRGRDGEGGTPPVRKLLYVPGQAEAARDAPTPEGGEEPPRKRAKTGAAPAEAVAAEAPSTAATTQPTTGTAETSSKPKNANKKQKREKTSSPNLLAMQPHCFHLLRALVSKHHSVRDALARSRPGDMEAYEGVLAMVERVVEEGIREYEATGGASYHDALDAEEGAGNVLSAVGYEGLATEGDTEGGKTVEYETSVEAVRECRRPWWVCQPYVRPLPMEAMAKGSLTMSKKELAKLREGERGAVMGMGARRNDGRQNGGVKGGGRGRKRRVVESSCGC